MEPGVFHVSCFQVSSDQHRGSSVNYGPFSRSRKSYGTLVNRTPKPKRDPNSENYPYQHNVKARLSGDEFCYLLGALCLAVPNYLVLASCVV